jgi:hypothetical protein
MADTFRKTFTELDADQKSFMFQVKDEAEKLLNTMNQAVPLEEHSERSRCMAIARTQLETAIMWAVKGITTKKE